MGVFLANTGRGGSEYKGVGIETAIHRRFPWRVYGTWHRSLVSVNNTSSESWLLSWYWFCVPILSTTRTLSVPYAWKEFKKTAIDPASLSAAFSSHCIGAFEDGVWWLIKGDVDCRSLLVRKVLDDISTLCIQDTLLHVTTWKWGEKDIQLFESLWFLGKTFKVVG